MFLAIAVLLIHPQLAATIPFSADKATIDAPSTTSASNSTVDAEIFSPTVTSSFEAAAQPAVEFNAALPDAYSLTAMRAGAYGYPHSTQR